MGGEVRGRRHNIYSMMFMISTVYFLQALTAREGDAPEQTPPAGKNSALLVTQSGD